tara:strand:+ start:3003 stop:3326 length:324 start_codon:yes stop_codon:yes gene_type:complete
LIQRKKSHLRKRKSREERGVRGKTIVNEFVVLKANSNQNSVSEHIIIISKKIGNAVIRNKIRRRLKHIIKMLPLKINYKLIFITKKTIVKAKFEKLNYSITQSINKL